MGTRHAILYCHGGGYTSGNLGYSRVLASKLAHATGYDVLSFEYRLGAGAPVSRGGGGRPAGLGSFDAFGLWRRGTWCWRGIPPAAIWRWCSATGLRQASRRLPGALGPDVPLDGYDHERRVLPGARGAGPHADPGVYRGGAQGLRGGCRSFPSRRFLRCSAISGGFLRC